MLEPAGRVASLRIMVGPVNNAALGISFVNAFERDGVAFANGLDSWRKVDVVGNQQGLPRAELEDKALVAIAIVVVRQDSNHFAATQGLLPGTPLLTGQVRLCADWWRIARRQIRDQESLVGDIRNYNCKDEYESFHIGIVAQAGCEKNRTISTIASVSNLQ